MRLADLMNSPPRWEGKTLTGAMQVLYGGVGGMGHHYDKLDADELCRVQRKHFGLAQGKDVGACTPSAPSQPAPA